MREIITAGTIEDFKVKMKEANVNYIGLSRNEKLEYNKLKNIITIKVENVEINDILKEDLQEIEAKKEVVASFGDKFVEELKGNVAEVTVEDKEYWTSTKNGILTVLYDRVMDGDFRSVLLKEKTKVVETKDDVIVCIQKLVDVVRDGEERAIIYEYVNQLRK